MPLPSFIVTGSLYEILGDIEAGELAESALTRATVQFKCNLPGDAWMTWDGKLERVESVWDAVVNLDGNIVLDDDDTPVQLLANDPGLNVTNLQWQVRVEMPASFIPPAGATRMRSFRFNAGLDGETIDLSEVVPVPRAPVSGVGGGGTPADGSITFTKLDAAAIVTEAETITANDNDTTLPTSAAVKDYVDDTVAAVGGGTPTDGTVTVAKFAPATLVTAAETIAANDNDTTIPTSAAVVDYADSVAGQVSDGAVTTAKFAAAALVTEAEGLASSDNDTSVPTTAAVKDYVDDGLAGVGGGTPDDGSVTTAKFAAAALVTEAEGLVSSDNDTSVPTTAAVRDYVDDEIAGVVVGAGDGSIFNLDGYITFSGKANGDPPAVLDTGQTVDFTMQNIGGRKPQVASGKLAVGSLPASGAWAVYHQSQFAGDIRACGAQWTVNTADGSTEAFVCIAPWASVYEAAGQIVPATPAHVTFSTTTGAWAWWVSDGGGTGSSHLKAVKTGTFVAPASDGSAVWEAAVYIDPVLGIGYLYLPGTDVATESRIITVTDAEIDTLLTAQGVPVTTLAATQAGADVLNLEHFCNTAGDTARFGKFLNAWADTSSVARPMNRNVVEKVYGDRNETIDADNNVITNLEVDNFKPATLITSGEVAGINSDAVIPTGAATEARLFTLAEDFNVVIADLQPLDDDLTVIAALAPADDDVLQRKAGAWTHRTITQLKTDLGSGTPDNGTVTTAKFAASTLVTEAEGIPANDNDTTIPTSGAVKDYVDDSIAGVGGGTPADGSVTTAKFAAAALVTEAEGLASSDNDTSVPTTAAVKDYVDVEISGVGGGTPADGSVTFAKFNAATIITEAETIAANDTDTVIPTAAAVKAYADAAVGTAPTASYTETIGDGTTLVFPIVHNLNTEAITYSFWDVATGAAVAVDPPVATDVDTLTLTFSEAPALNSIFVVVHGGSLSVVPEDNSVTTAKLAANVIPYDVSYVQTVGTRATGLGQNKMGIKLQRGIIITSITYRAETADASGNLTVELTKNGSAVAGTSAVISSANQVTGGTVTGSFAFALGDILRVNITGVGTTPGVGLTADMTATAN